MIRKTRTINNSMVKIICHFLEGDIALQRQFLLLLLFCVFSQKLCNGKREKLLTKMISKIRSSNKFKRKVDSDEHRIDYYFS